MSDVEIESFLVEKDETEKRFSAKRRLNSMYGHSSKAIARRRKRNKNKKTHRK